MTPAGGTHLRCVANLRGMDSSIDPETDGAADVVRTSRAAVMMIVVPALTATVVAAYLLATSVSASPRPLGCGVGSGCDEILSSRWSKVLGLPVGLPAMLLYVGVVVAAVARHRTICPQATRRLSALLWIAAGAILTSVSWFVGLQWIVLQVFCPWCLFDHGLGVLTAVAILVTEFLQHRFRPGMFVLGMVLSGLLAGVQILFPSTGAGAAALGAEQIEMLEGKLQFSPEEAPTLGSADSPATVVVLFDYCCPHCRQTHAHLVELQQRHPNRFRVVLLPVPLNADCNPAVEETEPRFAAACDLARLSLAVWRVDSTRFAEFDAWLFEPEQPRTAEAAQSEAERLIGIGPLTDALVDPRINARIAANVEAYTAGGIEAIPVLLSPGKAGVSGRVADAEMLEQVLQAELGLALD